MHGFLYSFLYGEQCRQLLNGVCAHTLMHLDGCGHPGPSSSGLMGDSLS